MGTGCGVWGVGCGVLTILRWSITYFSGKKYLQKSPKVLSDKVFRFIQQALNEIGINLIRDQISLDKEAEAVATRC